VKTEADVVVYCDIEVKDERTEVQSDRSSAAEAARSSGSVWSILAINMFIDFNRAGAQAAMVAEFFSGLSNVQSKIESLSVPGLFSVPPDPIGTLFRARLFTRPSQGTVGFPAGGGGELLGRCRARGEREGSLATKAFCYVYSFTLARTPWDVFNRLRS
jgi:hypothetical protein